MKHELFRQQALDFKKDKPLGEVIQGSLIKILEPAHRLIVHRPIRLLYACV